MDKDKLWFWGPIAAAVVFSVLWVRPCRRLPIDDEAKARGVIVPLDARDPSALIMGPVAERAR